PVAVHAVEGDDTGQGQPLVPIGQGVVACQRMQQGGSLELNRRVGIFTERRGLRAPEGRFEEAEVANDHLAVDGTVSYFEQFGQCQLDHCPSRSNASANRGNSSSRTLSSRSDRLWLSTYSRTACRATSCIDRPSSSARRRSASASSSLRRRVIAMR